MDAIAQRAERPPRTSVNRLARHPATRWAALAIALSTHLWLLALVLGIGETSAVRTDRSLLAIASVLALLSTAVLGGLLLVAARGRNGRGAGAASKSQSRQASEEAFLAVAEAARVAIVTTDAHGGFTYANAAAERMLGAARDQLRGVSSTLYVAPADRARFVDGLGKFLAGQGRLAAGAPVAFTGRRHDGEEFPAEIALSWFDGADGRYVTGVVVDLSERVRTEAAARYAEERWKVALESTDDGVWDWDVVSDTVHGSRRLFEMLGYDAALGSMSGDDWTALVHPEDFERFDRDLDAHLEGETAQYVSEYRVRCRDGSYRWLLARGRIITRDADGEPTRAVGTVADITERRLAEEALHAAREHAEQAARSKSDFLAVMSHELRTPLNGVLGMANLLSNTSLTVEQGEYLDMIARSGNALLRLIDDILDFSRIEAGRVVLEQVPCDVGALAREVVTLLGVPAHAKGLRIDAHVESEVPALVVTDAGRVRQVLFNLVGNAIKFTEAGSVHLRVACDEVEGSRATLRVVVTDTGIGIAEDTQRLLFQKFMQADASTTRRFGGTGLGLAISKGLVESLGGTIGVSSTVDVGSQFWFTLTAPLALSGALALRPAATSATLPVAAPETALGHAAPALRHRVLVAEDNPVNQRVAVRMLEKLGYAADVAADGREAVQMAVDGSYVAILMDCHMPQVDGYDATAQIGRLLPGDRRPPILAMTAADTAGDRERCLQAGMVDYLRKPVEMSQLRAMLDRWVVSRDIEQPQSRPE
jgi:PAS domain S-box-containing protein